MSIAMPLDIQRKYWQKSLHPNEIGASNMTKRHPFWNAVSKCFLETVLLATWNCAVAFLEIELAGKFAIRQAFQEKGIARISINGIVGKWSCKSSACGRIERS